MPLDFRGQKVRGKSFRGRKDLEGVDFSACDLSAADFRGCQLQGAKFDDAILLSTRFDRADLTDASFEGTRMGRTWMRAIRVEIPAFVISSAIILVAILVLAALANGAFNPGENRIAYLVACGLVLVIFALLIRYGFSRTTAIAVAGAVAVVGAGALGVVAVPTIVAIYYRARKNHTGFEVLHRLQIWFASLGGTSFRYATLRNTDFSGASLRRSDFSNARLQRTNWRNCRNMERAWIVDGRWQDALVRNLLTTGIGPGAPLSGRNLAGANLSGSGLSSADLSHADLTGASLEGANLTNANLAEVQALGTSFAGATLTGACLRDWNIDAQTNLEGVHCDYFFLLERENEKGSRDRRPHQPDAIFQPGTFEKLFAEVCDTAGRQPPRVDAGV